MTHFFEKRDRWGHGMALWVLVAMIFIAPPAFWTLKQIHLENDIETWLPEGDPQAKTLRWYLDNFQHEDRILVSWQGSTLNDPRVERFADRIRGTIDAAGVRRDGVKLIKSVVTPQDVIARMGVPRNEAVRRLAGVLIGTGPAKVRLTEAGRLRQNKVEKLLTERAREALGLEIEILPAATEWTGAIANAERPAGIADSTSVESTDVQEPFPALPAHDFQVRWDGMQPGAAATKDFLALAEALRDRSRDEAAEGPVLVDDAFFAAGSPVALALVLSEAGVADTRAAMGAIRQVAAEVGISDTDFHMGGRPVATAELNAEVKHAAWNADVPWYRLHERSVVLLSGIVGVVLAFVMLRSVRLAAMVLLVAYYTVLVTVALVPTTGGNMNMVLVVMPTLLLVLTISGAIHVANYWKHAVHHDPTTAVVQAAKMARTPCFLASATTAIGLLSLSTSLLAPVRDFGIYSAVGVLVSLVMVLYGLPSLLQFWPPRVPSEDEVDHSGWEGLGRQLVRYRVPVVFGSFAVFTAATCGLNWFQTETKAIRYFPEEARVVEDYNFLEENLAGIIPVDMVVRFNRDAQRRLNFLERMEIVREIENKVRRHPEISGTLSLADFRPVSERPPEDASFLVKATYNRRAITTETRVKEEHAEAARNFVTVAEEPADLLVPGDQKLNAEGDELWRITAQVAIMSDLNYGDLTADLDDAAQSILKYHAGASHVVTGMVPLFLRTQQAVLESLIHSFILAFAVIAVVMMIVLRNPLAGLIAMLPNLMPVGVVFGAISWYGIAVDIGTMITASVALGIAVDGTLHLLTWFRSGIERGLDRNAAVAKALGHCGPAMWQTTFAVGVGLFMLYPAELLLVSRFGWLMSALIAAALVGDIILLPALLAGSLGRLIEKSVQEQPDDKSAAAVDVLTGGAAPQPHLKSIPTKSNRALHLD